MEEKPSLSSAVLLADISDKLDRVASTSAQASLQTARAVRILDANQQLSARDRMALVEVVETQRRLTARLEKAVEQLSPRPASLTVVSDVKKRDDEEDWSLVHIQLPGQKQLAVPNRVLWAMVAGGFGALAGWLGHMIMKALSH